MEKKNNIRGLVIFVIVFISIVVIINFIYYESYNITWKTIICFALLIILVLSESFDSLSIPKILSLSRTVKEKDEENKQLKDYNAKIMSYIASINSNNSNQQHLYVGSISKESSKNIDSVDKTFKELDDVKENENITTNFIKDREQIRERIKYKQALEIALLKKAMTDKINPQYNVILTNNSFSNSKIMKDEIVFDSCVYEDGFNYFYQVSSINGLIGYYRSLYRYLEMVDNYQKYTNIPSKLILLIPKTDSKLKEKTGDITYLNYVERITKKYSPAINNGLLEITEIKVSSDDVEKELKNHKKEMN